MIKRKAINYEQWLADKDKNEQITNTELIPSTPSEYYSSWAPSTPSASSTPTPGANNAVPTVPTAPTTPTAEGGNSFAKWLSTDPAYQEAVKKAQMDYDRSRATYGAQGEALARSGLVGSGYSAWADSQAYAQMQREKENARNVGYAAWLGEEEQKKKDQLDAANALKGEQATIVEYILGQDRAEITDGDMALLKGLGYSDEAINGAATALLGYKDTFNQRKEEEEAEALKTQTSAILTWASEQGLEEIASSQIPLLKAIGYSDEAIAAAQNAFVESKQAETDAANKAFADSLAKFNTDGDAVAFLEANGIDATGMDDTAINAAVQNIIDSSSLTAEEKSAVYKNIESVRPEDLSGIGYKSIGEKLANKVETIADLYEIEKLTEADYNAVLESIINQIGGANVSVTWENNGEKSDDVTFTYTVNGKSYTITADTGGKYKVTNEKTLATLNAIYNAQSGTKSDVVYNPNNGKVYYYYADNNGDRMWTEIKAKSGNKGDKETQDAYLKAIAAYMSRPGNGERNAKEASSSISIERNTQPNSVSTDTARTLAEAAETTRTAYLNGDMTRDQAINWLMNNQKLTKVNAEKMVDLWAAK